MASLRPPKRIVLIAVALVGITLAAGLLPSSMQEARGQATVTGVDAQQQAGQGAASTNGIPQGVVVTLDRSVVRTPEEVAAAEALRPNLNPSRLEKEFRPTMDVGEYVKQKAASAATAGPASPGSPEPGAPPGILLNLTGLTKAQSGGLFPPDTDGAVGRTEYCQIVNSFLRCTRRSDLVIVRNQSLASFFGYFAQTLFDPRIVYDTVYNRWIVAAEAFAESSTVQRQFIATSLGPSATGGFRILNINVRALPTVGSAFWDYPMVGYDEDSIMISANLFNPGYVGSRLLFLNKARLYLGIGGSIGCIFFGGVFNFGTIGVPIVLDLNQETFTAQFPNASGTAVLTGFRSTDRVCPQVSRVSQFGVGGYSVPANATQPGTSFTIDTLDNRPNSVLTQVGTNMWGTHTVGPGANAVWRRLNIGSSLGQLAAGFVPKITTFAFNPSIAANGANTIFLTWSESGSFVRPVMRVGRKTLASAVVEGTTAFFSATSNTGDFQASRNEVRWGDYSSTRIDPLNASTAWSTNEVVVSGSWGSRIVRFGP